MTSLSQHTWVGGGGGKKQSLNFTSKQTNVFHFLNDLSKKFIYSFLILKYSAKAKKIGLF